MALAPHAAFLGPMLSSPKDIPAETELGRYGPLCYSTRLGWPEES